MFQQVEKHQDYVNYIRQLMPAIILLLNSDKTEKLGLGPHAAIRKFSNNSNSGPCTEVKIPSCNY